jgi:ribonuclease P protein component
MFAAANRLRRKADFDLVYREGKTLRTRLFRIKTRPNGLTALRFGVVVPNKLIKRATERNRKKRQAREAVKTLLPRLTPGHDVVLLAQGEAVAATYQEILADLETGFQKIHFFR